MALRLAIGAGRGRLVRQLETLENRVDALHQASDQAKAAAEQAQKTLEEAIARMALKAR